MLSKDHKKIFSSVCIPMRCFGCILLSSIVNVLAANFPFSCRFCIVTCFQLDSIHNCTIVIACSPHLKPFKRIRCACSVYNWNRPKICTRCSRIVRFTLLLVVSFGLTYIPPPCHEIYWTKQSCGNAIKWTKYTSYFMCFCFCFCLAKACSFYIYICVCRWCCCFSKPFFCREFHYLENTCELLE